VNSVPYSNSLQLIAFQPHIATDGKAQQTGFRDLGVNGKKSQVLPSEIQKTLGCYSYQVTPKKQLPQKTVMEYEDLYI
jgi:hypothetical protein